VKRNLTRGGDLPSSEAEPHARGDRPSSEAESHPRGRSSPQVRQGLVSAALCPSSEAEFRSGPAALVGRGPLPRGRGLFERVLGL
jgi:hypothetical protein